MARTMRGRTIDMASMAAAHGHVRAVGNAGMNARGDRLGPNGQILKTAEQIEAERLAYNRENPLAVSRASISALDADVFESPAAAAQSAKDQRKIAPPVAPLVTAPTKTKKIVED